MLPFCLGHHLLFRRLGLSFAGSPAADCPQADVLAGILICAQPYETTLAQIHSDEWAEVQLKWLKQVAKRRTDLDDAERRFRAYLESGYSRPPLWEYQSKTGIKFSAPWEQLLKVRLVMAGFSETEVLNGYLPGRWYDYFTAVELSMSDKCEDVKHWKSIFVTYDEAQKLEEIKRG